MPEIPKPGSARRCPACDSDESRGAGQKNGYHLFRCRQCHSLFSSSLPPAKNLYDGYYGDHSPQVPPAIITRIEEVVGSFGPYRSNNRLLDVGCGTGSYLSAAASQGWDARGVEVSKSALEQARSAGLNVFEGELGEASYPDAYFDVVTAVEVLEHVSAPLELVREIARVLRPGGLFWITTPHIRGLSYRLLDLQWSVISPPEHLQIFSRTGMRALLTRAGFHHIELRTYGFNPAEVSYTLRRRMAAYRSAESRAVEKTRQGGAEFNRVAAAYKLNTALMQGRTTRALKRIINGALNILRQGDTLHITASL